MAAGAGGAAAAGRRRRRRATDAAGVCVRGGMLRGLGPPWIGVGGAGPVWSGAGLVGGGVDRRGAALDRRGAAWIGGDRRGSVAGPAAGRH